MTASQKHASALSSIRYGRGVVGQEFRPQLPFQLLESSSAAVSIAEVRISSGAPEEM